MSVRSGEIPIRLGEQEYMLRPTLEAALALSRQDGGIAAAVNAVANLNLDVIIRVIRLGLGTRADEIRDLPAIVWRQGLTDRGNIVRPCIDYLICLANGGRPLDVTEADQDRAGPRPN